MSTIALLYPFGYRETHPIPVIGGDLRPHEFDFDEAMRIYWQICEANVEIGITFGVNTVSKVLNGKRIDFNGDVIDQDQPRKLIGATADYTSSLEFASPLFAESQFVPDPTPIGSDITFGAVEMRFRGEMFFDTVVSPHRAAPVILLGGGISVASTGAIFSWSAQEPAALDKKQGQYLSIDGELIQVWLSWQSSLEPDSGMIAITTTKSFIWPD